MADLTIFQTLGRKFGVTEPRVIRKAAELKNMLGVRGGNMSITALRLSDTASIVLCLDMAGLLLSQPVSKAEAIKLSGLKKGAYQVALKTLESVLELTTKTSLRDLAVQFGCLQALDFASQLLSRYEEKQCCDVDTNSSLFQTAALLCACRRQKVHVKQARLKEVSGVKRGTMDRLLTQMDKMAERIQTEAAQEKTSSGSKKRTLLDDVERALAEPVESSDYKKSKTEKKDLDYYKNVDYDEWKRKLLTKAAQSPENCTS